MIHYKPARSDLMGDDWTRKTMAIWQKMAERWPEKCNRPGACALWQWGQCRAAGMMGNVIASPQAMAIAGIDYPTGEELMELFRLSDTIFEELYAGIPTADNVDFWEAFPGQDTEPNGD